MASTRSSIAAGIEPRKAAIPGIDHAKVVSYTDVIMGRVKAGKTVAIIGSGGIGFDVAHTLAEEGHVDDAASFYKEWAVDMSWQKQGGLAGDPNAPGNSGHAAGAHHRHAAAGHQAARRAHGRLDRLDHQGAAEEARRAEFDRRRLREDRRRRPAHHGRRQAADRFPPTRSSFARARRRTARWRPNWKPPASSPG